MAKTRRKSKNNKIIKYCIGLAAGLLLLFGGITALGARVMPKYDTKQQNLWGYFTAGFQGSKDMLGSAIDATGQSTADLFNGKGFTWGSHYGQNFDNRERHSADGRIDLERRQYQERFEKFAKNSKQVSFDTGATGNFYDGSFKLLGIGKDAKLTNAQNDKVDNEFTKSYNSWYNNYKAKNKGNPSPSIAYANAMQLMGETYTKVLGKNNKRAKEVNAELGNQESKAKQENKKTDKTAGTLSDDSLSFSGKIAKAVLDMFYSSAIGSWMAKSGPGATIFATTYEPGETGAQTYSRIATTYNKNIYSTVFADTADTKSIANIGQQMGPMFLALAGVLIVITLIIQTGKMGWGQAFSPIRSRAEWYQNLIDTAIAVVGCICYGLLVRMILTINAAIVLGLAQYMAVTHVGGKQYTILSEAITLGFSSDTINMLTSGTFLGSNFVGIIFSIVYLMTYIGLAVYLKYYYFVREIVFVILWVLGPIFIAFWPSNWGKWRTINWFREFIGTVFVQSIHALTITFMATLMAWNNSNWAAMKDDITGVSSGERSANTLGKIAGDVSHFNIIGAGWHLISGTAQATGISAKVSVKNAEQHFETMVIGFIIMVLFQPLSRVLASLFGIQLNSLDEIHKSTSNSLKTTAMIGAAGIGAGALAIAGGVTTGGLGAASGLKGLKAGANAAKNAKKGSKLSSFKKAFGNSFNADNTLNNLRSKSAKALARINGIAGKSVGQLAAMSVAQGAGGDPNMALALSKAGGEIGNRAAHLTTTGLSKLGLKKADPNRKQKENLKKSINNATKKAATSSVKSSIDNAAGLDEQIKKASLDPNLDNNEEKQKAINEAKSNAEFAKDANLDTEAAAMAKAKRLTNGKNNYKSAQAINSNFRQAVLADKSLTPEQKKAALQQADQAMIKAGSAAYDPKIMFDKAGYADAEKASKAARKAEEKKLEQKYNAGNLAGAPTPDRMSFDEWKASDDFKQKYGAHLSNVADKAAQQALNNSNGHIYGQVDDNVFQKGLAHDKGAVINSDIYKNELSKGLKSLGIAPTKVSSLAATADSVAGRSLTQEIPTLEGNGESAMMLDNSLWHRLNNQAANTINSTFGGFPKVTGNDLDTVFSPQGNVYGSMIGQNGKAPSVSDFDDFVNNQDKAAYYAEGQKNWAQFHNMTSETASNFDANNPTSWVTHPSQKKWEREHPEFDNLNAPRHSYGRFQWNSIAQNRITDNPNLVPTNSSLNLEGAYNMLPKVTDARGNIGVKPGAFRMQIQNTHSMLQAQNDAGDWFTVGNLGRGDGTLGAGQTVYQDLDLSSNGTPSLRFDAATHSVASPYTLSDGQRIATSLSNGIPDLGSFFSNPSFSSSAPTNLGDFSHMPKSNILERARTNKSYPTLDQYGNYSDFALQGNNDSFIITGKNSLTGARETLTDLSQSAPELSGMPANSSYYIPLQNNGETGLDIEPNADSQIFFNGNVKQNDKRLANRVLDSFLSNEQRINNVNEHLHDTMLPYTDTYMRNFIANHPANMDGTNLDTFYKGIY